MMTDLSLDDVTAALESARVSPNGVSFAGKSLKLDTEEDAKPIIDKITNCKDLQFLNLEGNTLGVDASKAIGKALEKHAEFKRALWKDMFTGRMKTEIPKALEYLGNGLVTAGARLTELDMSDNAFGPIGVEGLASLLQSSSCFALEELRLNNNGLGIGGGKLLSSALLDCYNKSKEQGKPLALKVFIAGRNRLENDGAKALAEVFKTIGTLEEIAMPQNGIYHVGISALSEAFKNNKNLQILNLNDNTIGPKGAQAIAKVLPYLQNLREINFGDCLLKNKGAQYLASGLINLTKLEQLILSYNEIQREGGKELVKVLTGKSNLKNVILDGNQFGSEGRTEIKNLLKEIGKFNALGSLSDDESGESENEDNSEEEEESEGEVSEEPVQVETENNIKNSKPTCISVTEYLSNPSAENFLALGDDRTNLLISEALKNKDTYLESFVSILMNVAGLTVHEDIEVKETSLKCSEQLYREIFTWAQKSENISILTNTLLVHLGLIKSEDKKFKVLWNVEGCLFALENILKKNYVPECTRDTLKVFMQREIDDNKDYLNQKKQVLLVLKYYK